MSSSLRIAKSYKLASRSTVVLAASLAALVWGCGDVGVEDDPAESELPTAAEEGELPATAAQTELAAVVEASELAAAEDTQEADSASAEDKARLPVCDRTNLVLQRSNTQYFIAPAAAPGQGIFCAMSRGARGAGVRKLKENLINCHGATWDSLDGNNDYFGDGTVGAVQWIQREAGIVVDGVYGPQTFTTAVKWQHYNRSSGRRSGCYKFSG